MPEWNAALIAAVFLNPSPSRPTLSRIDTTGRLFEQVSGAKDRAGAKAKFIAAFGRDLPSIRAQFKWTSRITALTARDGIPPTFAALYLSLLAASGDDRTHAEGNFRSRMAALLQIEEASATSFTDLPRIWKDFAAWTRRRSESEGDCARLILPDPQSETLIGHSKRLAFPTYKDERRLRGVLQEAALDSQSDFRSVNATVFSRLSQFGNSFKEEASAFNELVARGLNQAAYDSPFWGAVRDITLDEEQEQSSKNGRFCLQLDVADPQSPELYLLVDELAAGNLGPRPGRRLPRPRGEYTHFLTGDDGPVTIDTLFDLAARHSPFAQSKVGRSLAAGVLAFLLDPLGNMATDGSFSDRAPASFVLRRDLALAMESISRHLGLRFNEARNEHVLGEWRAFSFDSLSVANLERLRKELPDGALSIGSGWKPPQPRIAGAARLGQAVFLNPASNPLVRMDGSKSGRYQLFGEGGSEAGAADLVAGEDGFYIPPGRLAGLGNVVTCRFVLTEAAGGREAMLEVPVVTEAPIRSPRGIRRGEWLVEGSSGVLEGIDDAERRLRTDTTARSVPIFGKWPLFQDAEVPRVSGVVQAALDAVPSPLAWLSEALLLRYQRRPALPFAELAAHTRMASEASGIPAWKLSRALFAAGWINVVESRLAPYAQVVPADRRISCEEQGGQVVARITGMLSLHEQHLLRDTLQNGERVARPMATDLELSAGCIELQLSSVHRAGELAAALGLGEARREWGGHPLGGLLHPSSRVERVASIPAEVPLQAWIPGRHGWDDAVVGRDLPPGTLLKAEGRQRTRYWARAGDGFLSTDSEAWARLLALFDPGPMGRLANNGDVVWSGALRALPASLRTWWLHWGGGCIALGRDGELMLVGGLGREVWGGIAFPRDSAVAQGPAQDQALVRRAFALALRRSRLRRSGAANK